MKTKLFLVIITFLSLNLISAQTVDIVTELSSPNAIAFNGDELFISEYGANKLSKIDITDTPPTATDVLTGLNGSYGLLFNGNELYFAEYLGNKMKRKLFLTSRYLTSLKMLC